MYNIDFFWLCLSISSQALVLTNMFVCAKHYASRAVRQKVISNTGYVSQSLSFMYNTNLQFSYHSKFGQLDHVFLSAVILDISKEIHMP